MLATLSSLAYECQRLGLKTGQIVSGELSGKLPLGGPSAEITAQLDLLLQAIKKELADNFFLHLPGAEAAFYRAPFGQMPKTYTAFPSATGL